MGQQVAHRDLRRTLGRMDIGHIAQAVNMHHRTHITPMQRNTGAGGSKAQLAHGIGQPELQAAVAPVAQAGRHLVLALAKAKAPKQFAQAAPAVRLAKRASSLPGPLGQQGARHLGRAGQRHADPGLTKQRRRLAWNQRRVEIGPGKRAALHHMAQKLHIGLQTDDVGLRQRHIKPRQRLFSGVAVDDQLGHHRVVIG